MAIIIPGDSDDGDSGLKTGGERRPSTAVTQYQYCGVEVLLLVHSRRSVRMMGSSGEDGKRDKVMMWCMVCMYMGLRGTDFCPFAHLSPSHATLCTDISLNKAHGMYTQMIRRPRVAKKGLGFDPKR